MDPAGTAGQFNQCHHAHHATVCCPDGYRLGSYSRLCCSAPAHVPCPSDTFCKPFVGCKVSPCLLVKVDMYSTMTNILVFLCFYQRVDSSRKKNLLKR